MLLAESPFAEHRLVVADVMDDLFKLILVSRRKDQVVPTIRRLDLLAEADQPGIRLSTGCRFQIRTRDLRVRAFPEDGSRPGQKHRVADLPFRKSEAGRKVGQRKSVSRCVSVPSVVVPDTFSFRV